MNNKQFWREIVPPKIKNNIQTAAILAFISAGMTAVMAIIISPLLLIDVILILALGLGILIGKSRICATVLLLYFIASKAMQLSEMNVGSLGIAIFFAAGYAMGVYGTFCYHNFKREYANSQISGY